MEHSVSRESPKDDILSILTKIAHPNITVITCYIQSFTFMPGYSANINFHLQNIYLKSVLLLGLENACHVMVYARLVTGFECPVVNQL
jgi:hypothetical protein